MSRAARSRSGHFRLFHEKSLHPPGIREILAGPAREPRTRPSGKAAAASSLSFRRSQGTRRAACHEAIIAVRMVLVEKFSHCSRRWESFAVATVENHSALTVVKNVCPLDCPDTCSMRVTVKDGVAIELKGDSDHRFTQGFLCQKMARFLERVYSPDRLLQPMKRVGQKGEGGSSRSAGTRPSTRSLRSSPRSPARVMVRRRSSRIAITAPWASSSPAASTGGSSTGWGPRCWTARSVPRPARRGTNTRSVAAAWGLIHSPCPGASSSSTGDRTPPTPTAISGA